MLKINLLPANLRPVKRTPLPHILSLAVLIMTALYMGQIFFQNLRRSADVEQQIARRRVEMGELSDIVNEHNDLSARKVFLQDKIQIIQTILAGRTIWSEQLHRLTELTPDNIWFRRIRLTQRKFPEERPRLDRRGAPELDPRTNRPVMHRVQVDRDVLEVSGYAVGGASGISDTATFAANTTADPQFAALFTLFTSQIIDTEYNGYPVRAFTFEYVISSQTGVNNPG